MSSPSIQFEVPEKRKTVLIANFMNADLNLENAHKLDIGHYISEDCGPGKKTKKQVLVAEAKRVSYVGQNFGPTADRSQNMCRYNVGLRDKKTGKMQICDTEIFQMIPKLGGDDDDDDNEELDEIDTQRVSIPSNLNMSQRSDILTEAFGSKKKQKAMEVRLRNQVTGEEMKQAVGSAARKALTDDRHLIPQTATEPEDSIIPPCNKEATSPADVYRLHDVISPAELDELVGPAQEFYDSKYEVVLEWRRESKYPKFIMSHLSVLPMTDSERWRKVKCLKYLQYMFSLYNLKPRELKQHRMPLPGDIPDKVRKSLLDKFTLKMEGSGKAVRCRPARLKDKLLAYIIVLCLLIDEFEFEFSDLLTDLQVSYKRLQAVFGTLGCQVKTKKNSGTSSDAQQSFFALLKIPLTFPTGPKRKAKRR